MYSFFSDDHAEDARRGLVDLDDAPVEPFGGSHQMQVMRAYTDLSL
jgi:hypothetical protein